jgi:hypothetical protein
MANRRYNTQTRKMFDSGSEPIKRGGLNFKTPAQKSHEKLKKQFNPSDYNITSAGGTKKTKSKDMLDRDPKRTMSPETRKRLRDAMERRRNLKRKEKKEKIFKEQQKPMKTKVKDKINKVKDKLNKVGDMKVKDAAKAVGKAALAATPVGAVKNAADTFNKNFKVQSPIVRKNRKFGGR